MPIVLRKQKRVNRMKLFEIISYLFCYFCQFSCSMGNLFLLLVPWGVPETFFGRVFIGVFMLDCLLMLWAFIMARFTSSYASRDWVPECTEKEKTDAIAKAKEREANPPSKEQRSLVCFFFSLLCLCFSPVSL